MPIRLLDAVSDAPAWIGLLRNLPEPAMDIYFTPEWVALHATKPGMEGKLFSFEAGGNLWAYPFVLLNLRRIGRRELTMPSRDIESAYGYGGPVSSTSDPAFLSKAWAGFTDWCREFGVVAEFARLHPLTSNEFYLDPVMDCTINRETVSIDLGRIRKGDSPFGSRALYMVRRAERAGVQVVTIPPDAGMPAYKHLYERAMDRLSAAPEYYFGDTYFSRLADLVTKSGWLLVALQQDRWIAAAVFLRGPRWMHYHLAATDSDLQVPGVMNLLLYRAAHLGAQEGILRLHLGGGATRSPKDPILRFKTTMATDTHCFRVAKRIHNLDAYDKLRSIWREEYPALVDRYSEHLLCYYVTA